MDSSSFNTEFIIYQISANKIVFYDERRGAYVRVDNGLIRCDEIESKSATVWGSPVFAL